MSPHIDIDVKQNYIECKLHAILKSVLRLNLSATSHSVSANNWQMGRLVKQQADHKHVFRVRIASVGAKVNQAAAIVINDCKRVAKDG